MSLTPEAFLEACKRDGVTIEDCRPNACLTLCKHFPAGDRLAYCQAESEVGVIYSAPSVEPGSVWGTDGGSIGGMVGLNGGYMRLHKSGVSKRWLAKLHKLVA